MLPSTRATATATPVTRKTTLIEEEPAVKTVERMAAQLCQLLEGALHVAMATMTLDWRPQLRATAAKLRKKLDCLRDSHATANQAKDLLKGSIIPAVAYALGVTPDGRAPHSQCSPPIPSPRDVRSAGQPCLPATTTPPPPPPLSS